MVNYFEKNIFQTNLSFTEKIWNHLLKVVLPQCHLGKGHLVLDCALMEF